MSLLNGALPVFALEGGPGIALLRGLVLAGLFIGFGASLYAVLVLPRAASAAAAALPDRLARLIRAGAGLATLALLGWLLAETAVMSSAAGPGAALAALPAVVADTMFGHLVCAQLACLALLWLAVRPAWLRLAASMLALLLQAGHSHAMAMAQGPSWLLLSDALHLLAGGAWLGGLLPLLLTMRAATPALAAQAARRFSPLGRLCVATLALTATVQGWVLVGSLPALVGTAYGWMALLKALLFALLVSLAWVNRYRLTPGLDGTDPERARRRLAGSIAIETGLGLALLLAAGTLAGLRPGMHDQPVWPFAQRFSLVTIGEDESFRREVVLALAALLVLVTPLLRRWWRLATLAAAAGIAALALPHLDLLLIEAYPTSFYRSPTNFSALSIAQGAALYPSRCAGCHGAHGGGDGPAAASLPVPPADLTAAHLWMHEDGELYWWLTEGIVTPDGRRAMPGFGATLDPGQVWALIDFIRANNAGQARRRGDDSRPVQAPGFTARCDGETVESGALRGRAILLLTADATPPAMPGFTLCVAADPGIATAYAVLSGQPDARAFLIDAKGWLRAASNAPSFDPGQQRMALTPLSGAGDPAAMPMDMKMDRPESPPCAAASMKSVGAARRA